MPSRLQVRFFVVALMFVTSGCERMRAYKTAWHAQTDPNRTGSLSISVEPREGVSIVLDGNRVAQVSPYHQDDMPLGQHVVEVRGMGFYPVTLPVTLERNRPVHIPVRLRVRAPLPFVPDDPHADGQSATPFAQGNGNAQGGAAPQGTPPKPGPGAAPPGAPPSAATAAVAAAPLRAPLPGNTRSLRMTVESRPACAISVDGTPADADNVVVHHADGVLLIGEMRLAYRVRPGRALELVIPHDQHERSAWWVGGLQVKAKSVVRVSANPIVLRRKVGKQLQTATVRRLD